MKRWAVLLLNIMKKKTKKGFKESVAKGIENLSEK